MVSELVFPASQMNPNNPEPLSMEARVCKLEAQVVDLGAQFQATEDLVDKLRVKMSNLRDEMFNFRNEILEALGLGSFAPPLMNPVRRGSTVQTPSMAPQPYQLSPPLVQLGVGKSDRSAPLVSAEESGYLVGGSEAVKIAGDSELLMTNQEVEQVEVELDVFYSNLRMQGCSGIPFDPGGILQCMSRPKSTAADNFGRHLQMKYGLIEEWKNYMDKKRGVLTIGISFKCYTLASL
ncbi:uncharacterized protein LOC116007194 isoform X2 [Ipomoea triloba]|uniref:uncharacterized protein LOC116007194 isoform X2 n=1 Tax=Ipomoea triloba TaxID=35885 RepID=UPI00125E7437|nr:uncharacterized protein LOC116007194 isoform X2 [Ipomoea triloba]